MMRESQESRDKGQEPERTPRSVERLLEIACGGARPFVTLDEGRSLCAEEARLIDRLDAVRIARRQLPIEPSPPSRRGWLFDKEQTCAAAAGL